MIDSLIPLAIILVPCLCLWLLTKMPRRYYTPCGNRDCKRIEILLNGSVIHDYQEAMKCPVCRDSLEKLLESTK